MGNNRREYQNKTETEIPIKLYDTFGVTKEEIFKFWNMYQQYKSDGINTHEIINYLDTESNKYYIRYYAALALEIITKEMLEGIQIGKEKEI